MVNQIVSRAKYKHPFTAKANTERLMDIKNANVNVVGGSQGGERTC